MQSQQANRHLACLSSRGGRCAWVEGAWGEEMLCFAAPVVSGCVGPMPSRDTSTLRPPPPCQTAFGKTQTAAWASQASAWEQWSTMSSICHEPEVRRPLPAPCQALCGADRAELSGPYTQRSLEIHSSEEKLKREIHLGCALGHLYPWLLAHLCWTLGHPRQALFRYYVLQTETDASTCSLLLDPNGQLTSIRAFLA